MALLLIIPLIAGAAWFIIISGSITSPAQRSPAQDDNAQAVTQGQVRRDIPVDFRIGASHIDTPDAAMAKADEPDNDVTPQVKDKNVSASPATSADPDQALKEEGRLRTVPLPASTHADATSTAGNPATPETTDNNEIPQSDWHAVTIKSGDTLSIAFNRNGLSYKDSLKIAHMPEYGGQFTRRLKAGDTLHVRADEDGAVLELKYAIDAQQTLEVTPDGDGFSGDLVLADLSRRKAYASGTINTSFYVDALDAGLSDRQIMRLVRIFGWDIDFALDIRPGDRFVVVYNELYREGEKITNGHILAASFANRGDSVHALRYTFDDGSSAYYSPEGRPMKKAFIRTPVDYTRISSGFSLARDHPILNRIRQHSGTDYAAPSGTPIKATGNGRILFRGRRGGYGNMIVIRHDDHLSTRYGHMSRFARDFGVGSRVKQGDIIGYVGMSGLATGPHLHYEFRVDGNPKDPETVALPKATPLPQTQLADFKQQTAGLLAQLETLTHTQVAQASSQRRPN